MYTHDWLFKCYKQQGDFRRALHHFSAFKSIYERLDRRKHARLILKIENENKVKESQDQLRELKEKHLSLQSQFYLIVPILGISVLMIFFLYRIYKKSRKEVKKITQLVIKNHIVLKDKTKIYINDLLYIKAEDHYIRVYTSDGKNHLVRGKLGDIAIHCRPILSVPTARTSPTVILYARYSGNFWCLWMGQKFPFRGIFKNSGHKKNRPFPKAVFGFRSVLICVSFRQKNDNSNTDKHL